MGYLLQWDQALINIGGLILLIIGLVIASFLGGFVEKVLDKIHADSLLSKIGLGGKVSISGILNWAVKLLASILVFFWVTDLLDISMAMSFLDETAGFSALLLESAIILVIGLVLGQLAQQCVEKIAKGANATAPYAEVLGSLAKWALVLSALMQTFASLNLDTSTLTVGLVAVFALAFGIGGKDRAAKFLETVGRK